MDDAGPALPVLVSFGRELRSRGFAVGTGRILTFARAVAALGLTDRASLYWAGRTTLVSSRADLDRYDDVFEDWYRGLLASGELQIELTLPGSARRDGALNADARVLDLQGRTVRVLHTGSLARGATTLAWDGRDSDGATLGAGIYFVRLVTPLGSASTRVVRFR